MKLDKDIWEVLKKIKEKATYTPAGQLLIYPIENAFQKTPKNTIEPAREGNAIYTLEEWGAFNIHTREQVEGRIDFYLEILPKLDEIYKENQAEGLSTNHLKSIHLVTTSLEPTSVIFLVLDERFEMPIRCAVWNYKGEIAYIKKLYDIAYPWDVPNKKVGYNKFLADNINNGLFKKGQVARYMKTNKLKKPTLVQKSEDGKSLVLKIETPVKTGLVKNAVPPQHQPLYIDKTR